MTAVPLPTTSMPGRHPQESAGRLINCFAEPLGPGARSKAVIRRAPGLKSFGTTSGSGFRGALLDGNTLYAAWDKVYSFTSAGGAGTLVGSLSGTEKAFWAKNNKTPTADKVLVVPGEGAFVVTASAVSDYPDSDVGQPNAVCFLDGFFFFTYGNAQCIASALNDTAIDALNVATAEAKSDTLLRPVPFNETLFLCGTDSIEAWSGNPVNATGFPFNRVTVIQPGLAGRYAIAGHEDGFGKALVYVGSDNAVHRLTGYTHEKISPPDLDRLIEAVSDKDTLEAGVYIARGHSFWVLSSDDWTWAFDLNNNRWHERASYLKTRWRGTQPVWAFEEWICGDTESGNLGQIDQETRTEFTDPLRARIESAPVAKFPAYVAAARIDVDITVGVGDVTGTSPIQTDPTIEISCSRNGGVDWDVSRIVPLGQQAVADQRVYATRFGQVGPQGVRFRFDVSSPVEFGLMGADVTAAAL